MRLRLTLKVGVMKPLSTVHGSVTTTRQSSCSCGSSVALMRFRCALERAPPAPRARRRRCGVVAASGVEHHDAQRLAEVGAGDAAGLDRGVHHQPVLDRRRRDVLALAGLEQVLHAAGDAQVALGVERALVAGVQPAVGGEGFARQLGLLVVAEHQAAGSSPGSRRSPGRCATRRRRTAGPRCPAAAAPGSVACETPQFSVMP